MSAIGPKRTSTSALHMSAFGVKRTWAITLHMSAYDPNRTWMTPSAAAIFAGTIVRLGVGADNAAARVHHTSWRFGGVAARRARCPARDAGHRFSQRWNF